MAQMMNPAAVMKLLNKKKELLEKNPYVYPFIKKWFGSEIEKGTVLEMRIIAPSGECADSVKIEVTDSEAGFFEAVNQLLR